MLGARFHPTVFDKDFLSGFFVMCYFVVMLLDTLLSYQQFQIRSSNLPETHNKKAAGTTTKQSYCAYLKICFNAYSAMLHII